MKKLMLIVLLALFASACGGSGDDAAGDSPTEVNVDDTDATAGDGDDDGASGDVDTSSNDDGDADQGSSDAPADDEDDTRNQSGAHNNATPPEPLSVELIQERDCVHEVESGPTVELPPAEKPPVADEYLVGVDELKVTDLIVGTGEVAELGNTIDMQYVGVLADGGTEFDASWNRGAQPFTFQLGAGRVIQGWDLGIEGMRVGGRRVLQIPAVLAYGDTQRSEIIGPNADLVFIVDLVGVSTGAQESPPIDAINLGSFSELQITDLVEGDGCTAEYGDIVSVNYVGVDAVTGEEFDSSWGRGAPFDLIVGRSQVIDGWNDGIEGMKVGGERILQIPGAMAYGEDDLVFRVHLERLIEAPEPHKIEFQGDPPTDIQVDTLLAGDGDSVESGDIIDVNLVVAVWRSNQIVQSSWQDGTPAQLAMQPGSLIPGLEDSILGTKLGERRQIVLPPNVAYPNGVPPNAGIEEDDALVFIIELLRITG